MSEAKKRVEGWLRAEYSVEEDDPPRQEDLEWFLRANVGGVTILAIRPEERPYISVESRLVFSNEHQRAFEDLDGPDQAEFQRKLAEKLVYQMPDFEWKEAEGKMVIVIRRMLYPEDLTRQSFMDALRTVFHCTQGVNLFLRGFLSARIEGISAPEIG